MSEVVLHYSLSMSEAAIDVVHQGVSMALAHTRTLRNHVITDSIISGADERSVMQNDHFDADLILRRFNPSHGRLNIIALPGDIYHKGFRAEGIGAAHVRNVDIHTIGHLLLDPTAIAGGLATVSVPKGPKSKNGLLIKTIHEVGHALGLVEAQRRTRIGGHCGNICVMRSGEQNDHPMRMNFLVQNHKPFCDPCEEYLSRI